MRYAARLFLVMALAISVARVAGAEGPPLARGLGSYHILGLRSVNLKNYTLLGACNVGVDCAQPSSNSDCGVLSHENAFYADGAQAAGDHAKFTKAGASLWQVFANQLGSPENVEIRLPGSGPAGAEPLAPLPIVGDRDADGVTSCRTVGGTCAADAGDLERACGFPSPFPACNPGLPVTVLGNADCGGVADGDEHNGRCDLAPGVYGALQVQNQGKVTLAGGVYVFCSIGVGKNTSIVTRAASTIYTDGDFLVNNEASVGQQCGDLTVLAQGPGSFGFGRNSSITGVFCAPDRLLQLGHDNDLTGRFYAGEVNSDSNNRGRCCSTGGDCACIDLVTPETAHAGAVVTLQGPCSLERVTAVRICDVEATIESRSDTALRVVVPAGVGGACGIQVESPAGAFRTAATLEVGP